MTDYCRLCAEIKESGEILASIDDVEQSMEQKLRACCQWTTENIEHRLPYSVCSICLDKLDKCWLFTQSVQLAQQRLLEIFENDTEVDTKPLVVELVQNVYDSAETSNSFPYTYVARNSTFNQKSFGDQRFPNVEHKCATCMLEFCTAPELDMHRQQGCEGLIQIDSSAVDCKPTAVDIANTQCDVETSESPTIDVDESMNSKKNASRQKRIKARAENKRSPNKKKNNEKAKSIGQSNKRSIKGDGNKNLQNDHSKRLFECWLCHKLFKTRKYTYNHIKIHVPNAFKQNWICELCGGAFRHAAALFVHTKLKHTHERPYKCETCGLGFKIELHLKNHRRTHNALQFKCNQCEKTFKWKSTLKQHMETHSGVIAKPFVCDLCGLGFRQKVDLKEHRRTHTGEKPYTCEHCPSSFSARSSYYGHIRRVHGISMLAQKKVEMTK